MSNMSSTLVESSNVWPFTVTAKAEGTLAAGTVTVNDCGAATEGGQAEDSSVSCFWLVKGWEPVPTAASAWSGVAWKSEGRWKHDGAQQKVGRRRESREI